MLFYQRRKIDNMECSGTSSTSGDHWVSKIAVAPSLGETASTSITPTDKTTSNTKRSVEIDSVKVVPDDVVRFCQIFCLSAVINDQKTY